MKNSIKWVIGFMMLCLMGIATGFDTIGLYYLNYIILCVMCFALGYIMVWKLNETKNEKN